MHNKKPVFSWHCVSDGTEENVNKEYLKEYYSNGVQGCDVFPMYVDIVPDDNKVKVVENLKRNIENNNFCFDTGIFGTGYILDVLSRYELNDYAYKLRTQTKYPSYGNMLKQGATAVWETWEGTEIKLEVTVPFNTTANLNISGKSVKLHCGKTVVKI